jgi:hypothetical protein
VAFSCFREISISQRQEIRISVKLAAYRIESIALEAQNDRLMAMKPTDENNPRVAYVLRDLVEHGLGEPRLPLTAEYRQDLRDKIAQGLQSLREGKGTGGEAFVAHMDAELAELERQGR